MSWLPQLRGQANGSPFCKPDDSGSFCNAYGGVISLLIAGFEQKNTVFSIHISDVFDNIKEITGVVDVQTMESNGGKKQLRHHQKNGEKKEPPNFPGTLLMVMPVNRHKASPCRQSKAGC